MSKKKGRAKKRRPKRHGPLHCPSCHSPADASLTALLTALAACLNSASDAGIRVLVRHGVVIADGPRQGGYVINGGNGRWRPVTLPSHPDAGGVLTPADGLDD